MTAASKSYENDYARKKSVKMKFTAIIDDLPKLEMYEKGDEKRQVCVKASRKTESAVKSALTCERAATQLRKLGNTVFCAEPEDIEVNIDEGIAFPASEINDMRRRAADELIKRKLSEYEKRVALSSKEIEAICGKENLINGRLQAKDSRGLFIYSRETLSSGCPIGKISDCSGYTEIYIPLELYMEEKLRDALGERLAKTNASFLQKKETSHPKIIPYILNVSKGNLDRYINESFGEIVDQVSDCGIMICGMEWIGRFAEAGVKVYGGYGLNVYNSQSLKTFDELGVEVRGYSHEADEYLRGDIPLMITEHPVSDKAFKDRKGAYYDVMKWHSRDKYLVFKEESEGVFAGGKRMMTYVK